MKDLDLKKLEKEGVNVKSLSQSIQDKKQSIDNGKPVKK